MLIVFGIKFIAFFLSLHVCVMLEEIAIILLNSFLGVYKIIVAET